MLRLYWWEETEDWTIDPRKNNSALRFVGGQLAQSC